MQGMLLVPLYLKYIPLDLYGYWLATGNMIGWVLILDPGFSAVVQQQVAASYGSNDRAHTEKTISASLALALVAVFLAGITCTILTIQIPSILGIEKGDPRLESLSEACVYASIGTALGLGGHFCNAIAVGLQGSTGPGSIAIGAQVAGVIATVALLLREHGIIAIAIGAMCRGAVMFFGSIYYLIERKKCEKLLIGVSFREIKSLLNVTGATILGRVPTIFANQIDILVVARSVGPEAASAFGLSRKAMEIARMLIERPAVAMMPVLAHHSRQAGQEAIREKISRLIRYSIWGTSISAVLCLLLNYHFVALWAGPNAYAGIKINFAFVTVMVFAVMMTTLSNLGFALGDVRGNSIASFVVAVINIITVLAFATTGSAVLIASAPLVGLLSAGAFYYPAELKKRLGLSHLEGGELNRALLASVAACGIAYLLFANKAPQSWKQLMLMTSSTVGLNIAVLYMLSEYFRSEIRCLKKYVHTKT